MIDAGLTIISQYSNSPTLTSIIENINSYVDPSLNINLFVQDLWNVDTAIGYGLDVWGRIVGVTRVVQIAIAPPPFGFYEALPYGSLGFDQAPFWDGASALLQPFNLPDTDFRKLILAKALANISDGSIPSSNQVLLTLFAGRGDCYVTDGLNMTMTYQFTFSLTQVEQAIIAQSGVLPKPAGVAASVVTP